MTSFSFCQRILVTQWSCSPTLDPRRTLPMVWLAIRVMTCSHCLIHKQLSERTAASQNPTWCRVPSADCHHAGMDVFMCWYLSDAYHAMNGHISQYQSLASITRETTLVLLLAAIRLSEVIHRKLTTSRLLQCVYACMYI